MIQRALKTRRTRPLLPVVAVALALMALAISGRGSIAADGEGVNWEVGNFCVNDYQANSNCTAEDVRIASIAPTLTEVCTAAGDYATASFKVEVIAGASERYDIGLFVATEGGDAQTGDNCYHDFLQPASTIEPWDLVTGYGPFRETEGSKADACGDTLQGESNFYYLQQEVTIKCVDANNDGVVDPISTCTSWDNNTNGTCLTVKNAYPSTDAKCKCQPQAPDPPVLIYRGYDWGDLPDIYDTLTNSNGARHAIQDPNNDNTPDTIIDTKGTTDTADDQTVPAVWLGSVVDYSPNAETDGQPDVFATGDDTNIQTGQRVDDEDGVALVTPWAYGTDGGKFSVTVSTSGGTCAGCRLAFWIDWNDDGDFGDANESFVKPVSAGTQIVSFDVPAGLLPDQYVYTRFRLYDDVSNASIKNEDLSPTGVVVNGEVEDYLFDLWPTAVELMSFTAKAKGNKVELQWETASEIDNLGFNLYRATSEDGEQTQLNDVLIPAAPGGADGATYEYVDTTVEKGTVYYYWVEDVDTKFKTDTTGPIEVNLSRGRAIRDLLQSFLIRQPQRRPAVGEG